MRDGWQGLLVYGQCEITKHVTIEPAEAQSNYKELMVFNVNPTPQRIKKHAIIPLKMNFNWSPTTTTCLKSQQEHSL